MTNGGEDEVCKEKITFSEPLPITSSPRWRGPPRGSPRTRPCAPATSTAWPARGSPAVPGAPGAATRKRGRGLPRGAPAHGTCGDDGAARGLLCREEGSRPGRHMLPPGSSPGGSRWPGGGPGALDPHSGSRRPTWAPLTCPRRERRRAGPVAAAEPAERWRRQRLRQTMEE